MKLRVIFFITFFFCAAAPLQGDAVPANSQQQVLGFMPKSAPDVIEKMLNKVDGTFVFPAALSLAVIYCVSIIHKDNPDFFSSVIRTLEWPFFLTQRKLEYYFCRGKSVTWDEVASWHNRVARMLMPLTKATAVIDLSKERRLKVMDQEDEAAGVQDVQWAMQVAHIEKEFSFLKKVLTVRLRYYKDVTPAHGKKKKQSLVTSVGKKLVRTSLSRNEEIAFGIEESITYLDEIVMYCKSVKQFSLLDKEYLKRLISSLCTTFEHIGVLVDEVSAADQKKKKIPMSADGSLTRSYTAGSEGSYGSYGSSSSYGGF